MSSSFSLAVFIAPLRNRIAIFQLICSLFISYRTQTMDYFHQPNEFSDVKISFKNETGKCTKVDRCACHVNSIIDVILYANKAILSEASPIIKAFLAIEPDSPFIIDEDDEQSSITSTDMIELLKFIYPQFTIKITEQNSEICFPD